MSITKNKETIKLLQQNLGYQFHNINLLTQALTHPSIKGQVNHNLADYERLELLGDSILNFAITELLFYRFKDYNEGQLSKYRNTLVCKTTLHEVAMKIQLPKFLIMTRGEEITGGRTRVSNLENAIEAIIAAIYLDSDIHKVKEVINKLWAPLIQDEAHNITHDPKGTLQEWLQSQGMPLPTYIIIEQLGAAHEPLFKVRVTISDGLSAEGIGNSRKIAEKEAALNMLTILNAVKEKQPK